MDNYKHSLTELKKINSEFKFFCSGCGKVSIADERMRLIEKILISVLNWKESAITKQFHKELENCDYTLNVGEKQWITLEAKERGETFLFPQNIKSRSLQISDLILTDNAIKTAVQNVRSICNNSDVKYAVVTNAYSWIIFNVSNENRSWEEGSARVFSSLKNIIENFAEFWNLLAYDSICNGSLDKEFESKIILQRVLPNYIHIHPKA